MILHIKRLISVIVVVIFIVAIGAFVGYLIGYNRGWEKRYPGIFCTDEAKLCSDGSTVGRRPPKCDFAPCPGNEPAGPTGIQGEVLIYPKCSQPPEIECAPNEPYKTDLVLTDEKGERVIKEFQSDENGRFFFAIDFGGYAIRSADIVNASPYCTSIESFFVSPGQVRDVLVICDTNKF